MDTTQNTGRTAGEQGAGLKDQIHAFIREKGSVTFCEVSDRFGEGDSCIGITDYALTAIGLSREVCDALQDLRYAGKVVDLPTSPMTILVDTKYCLPIPFGTDEQAHRYRTPHLIPVALWAVDDPRLPALARKVIEEARAEGTFPPVRQGGKS